MERRGPGIQQSMNQHLEMCHRRRNQKKVSRRADDRKKVESGVNETQRREVKEEGAL